MPDRATLVPEHPADVTMYLVLDDLGKSGRVWRENNEHYSETDVLDDIASGQYHHPVRVVAFNTAEAWSRDATEDMARALLDRARRNGRPATTCRRVYREKRPARRRLRTAVRDAKAERQRSAQLRRAAIVGSIRRASVYQACCRPCYEHRPAVLVATKPCPATCAKSCGRHQLTE